MTCLYCHGVLVKERLYDLLESDAQIYMTQWCWVYRCTACSKISHCLVENQLQSKMPLRASSRDAGELVVDS